MSNLFEQATRRKLRFPSPRGPLTVEQLWDLPLQSKASPEFSLDAVARAVNADLKATAEESFVAPEANSANSTQQLMLDIVKHVIAVRIADNKAAESLSAKRAERQKLLGLLEKRKDEALESLTPEQIEARLAALGV